MKILWLDLKKISVRQSLKSDGIAIVGRNTPGRANNKYEPQAVLIDIDKAKELADDNPAIKEALEKAQ